MSVPALERCASFNSVTHGWPHTHSHAHSHVHRNVDAHGRKDSSASASSSSVVTLLIGRCRVSRCRLVMRVVMVRVVMMRHLSRLGCRGCWSVERVLALTIAGIAIHGGILRLLLLSSGSHGGGEWRHGTLLLMLVRMRLGRVMVRVQGAVVAD